MWARSLADGERYEASASVCSMCLGIGFVYWHALQVSKQTGMSKRSVQARAALV